MLWAQAAVTDARLHLRQVVVNYVAKTPNGKVFDNSLAKNAPYYIRVGSGAVIPVCKCPRLLYRRRSLHLAWTRTHLQASTSVVCCCDHRVWMRRCWA